MNGHITHADLVKFADDKVNLKADQAKKLRKQANGLRDKLDAYIQNHPDFALKKMMLSGSLAKSTALKSASDIDVAVYVSNADAPGIEDLAAWLANKLRTAYPNKSPDDITPGRYSVCIHFRGTGLDVDVVPILYDGNAEWDGDLVNRNDGSTLMTNIPRQLEFMRTRIEKTDSKDYRQVIRLLKYWAKQRKITSEEFRCKSFFIELLVAHLFDAGRIQVNDYIDAIREFFDQIVLGLLDDRIAFSDYYKLSEIPASNDLVQVIDPVNPENNVVNDYLQRQLDLLQEEAQESADAIEAAMDAPTKSEALSYWRTVFGSSFSV